MPPVIVPPPPPWVDTDVGSPAISGGATYPDSVFTVNGSGSDIWNTSDQCNFLYQPQTGNFAITARVASELKVAPYAKAGVMMRESTAGNSIEVSVLLTATNGVSMQLRPSAGASSTRRDRLATRCAAAKPPIARTACSRAPA